MDQYLKPISLVLPLSLESEFSLFLENEHVKCNDSGTVSCGKPGELAD